MTLPITIEELETRHSELGALIEKFKQQRSGSSLSIPGAIIGLNPGEVFAGLVVNDEGTQAHYLILLPACPGKKLSWPDAMAWAEKEGGALPTRREQPILFANAKKHFEADWYWSSETHEKDASYAWYQDFSNGYQGNYHKSYEGRAVAVRRVPL